MSLCLLFDGFIDERLCGEKLHESAYLSIFAAEKRAERFSIEPYQLLWEVIECIRLKLTQ